MASISNLINLSLKPTLKRFSVIPTIPFNPLSLFLSGEQGVWYDPSYINTLFQDAAGTTPVTATGQPVGRVLDKSGRSNHATQPTAASRLLFNIDTVQAKLTGDGIDDNIASSAAVPWLTGEGVSAFFAVAYKRDSGVGYVVHCDGGVFALAGQAFSLLANAEGSDIVVVGGVSIPIPTSTAITVISIAFNKTTGAGLLSVNGAAETNVSVGTFSQTIKQMRIFSREGGAYFNGSVYGVVSVAGIPPLSTRQAVVGYLQSRAGVVI